MDEETDKDCFILKPHEAENQSIVVKKWNKDGIRIKTSIGDMMLTFCYVNEEPDEEYLKGNDATVWRRPHIKLHLISGDFNVQCHGDVSKLRSFYSDYGNTCELRITPARKMMDLMPSIQRKELEDMIKAIS